MKSMHWREYSRLDYDSMYEGFLKAVDNCARTTKQNFRRDNTISIWVAIAAYRWTNKVGKSVRQKQCHVWRVPAAQFWPGGVLPAILKAYPRAIPVPPNDINATLRYIYEERVRISAEKLASGENSGTNANRIEWLKNVASNCADDLTRFIADQGA